MVEENLPEPQAALPPLQPEPEKPKRHGGQWALMIIAVLALAAAVVFLVLRIIDPPASPVANNVERNENPGLDGIIATEMPPVQLQLGDCLRGFNSPLDPQTVVTCDSAHNAQMIGSFEVTGTDYPGAGELLTQSEDLCKSVSLDPSAGLDSTWTYHFSRPSESTWDQGDRAVSCFLSLKEGNVRSSLLPPEATDDAADGDVAKPEDQGDEASSSKAEETTES
ncbi:septum formation family protein [Glutamicibacter sp. JL.03c]|uniref:septum formation family protein n=1 Tax=Glutamicibacter sp. JL.03c TaxID=2984842 RepID=UPI0021F7B41B|nr:septum formation family protein [Glutamicibacter sp. JL.03c]UYQ76746.1 septum formation family protein [Glutamicibacter sp. JL.03c]